MTRIAATLLASAVILSSPSLALASSADPNWATTFPPGPVATHVGQPEGRIIVVAVGKSTSSLKSASAALKGALERSGEFASVTRAPDKDTDDDAALARKLAKGKADRVLVVRVFDEFDELQAVVTVFDADGEVVDAFTGRPGLPVASAAAASTGVTSEAADAALGLTELEGDAPSDDSKTEYDRNFVWFEEGIYAQAAGNVVVIGKSIMPMRGKQGEPLAGIRFYQHVERNDLAKSYRNRKIARISLWSASGVFFIVGLGAGLGVGLTPPKDLQDCEMVPDAEYVACDDANIKKEDRRLAVGLGGIMGGFMGAGIITMVVAVAIKEHPVNAAQARTLVGEYNEKLRKKLGLPSEAATSRVRIGVRPVAGLDGAGVRVVGHF